MANRVKGEGGYDKHGNYIRFRITINGKSKEFFGKTKKEAHDKYLRYIEENPDGKAVAKKLTFGDCAEKWYREIKSKEGISYKSRKNYELYVSRIKALNKLHIRKGEGHSFECLLIFVLYPVCTHF